VYGSKESNQFFNLLLPVERLKRVNKLIQIQKI
jgi:hypothetical protein